MFCMNCGSELSDNAKFCMSCGARVVVPVNQGEFSEDEDNQAAEKRRREKPAEECRRQESESVTEELEIGLDDIPETEDDDLAGMTIKKKRSAIRQGRVLAGKS